MGKLVKNPDVLKQVMATIQKDRLYGELRGVVE